MWQFIAGVGGWLFKLFGGKTLNKVLDRVLETVDKRITSETEREKIKAEITKKFIDAQVESSVIRKEAFGPWSWMMATLFLPGPALWMNMVFLDSVFNFPWDVLALPSEFYPWLTTIIGALFFAPTINNLFKK